MKSRIRVLVGVGSVAVACGTGGAWEARGAEFEPPTRVLGGGEPVRVEAPGYAAPCLADIDGDGKKDLLVGQFRDGKIRCYPGTEDGTFAAGNWLQADGRVALVPGVW